MTRLSRNTGMVGFLVLCTVWLSPASLQAELALRWRFEPGQSFKQVLTQDMNTSAMLGAQVVETKIVQTVDIRWNVRAVDDQGVAELDKNFERVRLKMNAIGGLGFEFESQSEEPATGIGKLLAPALKSLAQSKYRVKISPRGEILDVKIQEDATQALQAIPGIGQMITPDSLVGMVKNSLYPFPAEPVNAGDSWKSRVEHQLPQLGKMVEETNLTYVGQETVDGKPLERVNLSITTQIPQNAAKPADLKFAIKEQTTSGMLLFDQQAGHLTRVERTMKMVIDVQAQGRQFPQTINQVVTTQFEVAPPQ